MLVVSGFVNLGAFYLTRVFRNKTRATGLLVVLRHGQHLFDLNRGAVANTDLFVRRTSSSRCLSRYLQKLNHPNIVRCLWWDYSDFELKIGLELATGGDLRRIIREHYDQFCLIPEPIIWSCAFQLSSALYHMYTSKIMHRGNSLIFVYTYGPYFPIEPTNTGQFSSFSGFSFVFSALSIFRRIFFFSAP